MDGWIGMGIIGLLAPFALVLVVALAILLFVPLAIGAAVGVSRRLLPETDPTDPIDAGDALGRLFGSDPER